MVKSIEPKDYYFFFFSFKLGKEGQHYSNIKVSHKRAL